MAFYTPRGLKIRVSVPYAFSLLGRLYAQVHPSKVLETAEAFDEVPVAAAHIAALACLALRSPVAETVLWTVIGTVAGHFVLRTGLWVPGLLTASGAFSRAGVYRTPLVFILGYAFQSLPHLRRSCAHAEATWRVARV